MTLNSSMIPLYDKNPLACLVQQNQNDRKKRKNEMETAKFINIPCKMLQAPSFHRINIYAMITLQKRTQSVSDCWTHLLRAKWTVNSEQARKPTCCQFNSHWELRMNWKYQNNWWHLIFTWCGNMKTIYYYEIWEMSGKVIFQFVLLDMLPIAIA